MKIFFLLSALLPSLPLAGILPDYDPRCDAMSCHAALIDPISIPSQRGYFNQKAPKIIHQIWFGEQSKGDTNTAKWQEYAKKFSYEYHLWTKESDPIVKTFMNPRNYDLMVQFRREKNDNAAANVLQYELIDHFGGIYVDCGFAPPTVDLEKVINFKGLTLMTEHDGRNIGTSSIFVTDRLIIASAHHPVMAAVVEQVYDNVQNWRKVNKQVDKYYDTCYVTGAFLLNRVLSGFFTVTSCTYLEDLGMK